MSNPLQKSTDCQCQMWNIQWRICKIEGTLVDQGHYFRYFGPSFLATKIKREQVAEKRAEKRKEKRKEKEGMQGSFRYKLVHSLHDNYLKVEYEDAPEDPLKQGSRAGPLGTEPHLWG